MTTTDGEETRCLACHSPKRPSEKTVYPYADDDITQDVPVGPLFKVECEGNDGDFRMAILCHDCWHRLCQNTQGVDMWISQRCWESLAPLTPFRQLPEVRHDR